MTWQGVAWAIGGGALVPVETARLLAYLAIGGMEGEGVVGPGDCAVLPQVAPNASVRIMPGAIGVLNRMADPLTGGQQAYLCRQPYTQDNPWEDVPIVPTGGSSRTDIVAVIVEDPQYAGQSAPAEIQNGPYVKTVVYSGVSSGVTTLAQIDPGQAGYALARITLPAGTSQVTAAHITDLRQIPNPRTRQETKLLNCPSGTNQLLTSVSGTTFPSQASWNVAVPKWAVRAHLELYVAGVKIRNTKARDPDSDADDTGNWLGSARLAVGSITTDPTEVNPNVPQAQQGDTFTWISAGEVAVPKALRGTTQQMHPVALRGAFSAGIEVRAEWGTTVIAKVTWFEDIASDAWEV